MGASLCSLCESSVFGARPVFGMDACHVLAIIPLTEGLCCGDQSLHWMLGGASSLLCGCHSPVGSRVCSPVVGVEAPRSSSKLQCEVGRTGMLSLGKGSLCIFLQELSTRTCNSVMSPATRCVRPQSTILLALSSNQPPLQEHQ